MHTACDLQCHAPTWSGRWGDTPLKCCETRGDGPVATIAHRPGGGAAGVEGGSDRVSGRQLMDVWDRLCSLLGARAVSVEDVSNKARLLLLPGTGPAGVEGVTAVNFPWYPGRRCDL